MVLSASSSARNDAVHCLLIIFALGGVSSAPMEWRLDDHGQWYFNSNPSLSVEMSEPPLADPTYLPYIQADPAIFDVSTSHRHPSHVEVPPAYFYGSASDYMLQHHNPQAQQFLNVPYYDTSLQNLLHHGQAEPQYTYHYSSPPVTPLYTSLQQHSDLFAYPFNNQQEVQQPPTSPLAPTPTVEMLRAHYNILESNPNTNNLYGTADYLVDDHLEEPSTAMGKKTRKSKWRKEKADSEAQARARKEEEEEEEEEEEGRNKEEEVAIKRPRGRPRGQFGPRFRLPYSKPSIYDTPRIAELKISLPGRYNDIVSKYRSFHLGMSKRYAQTDIMDGADKDLGYDLLNGAEEEQQKAAAEKIAEFAAQRRLKEKKGKETQRL